MPTKLFYNGKEPLSLPKPYDVLLRAGVTGYLRDSSATIRALFPNPPAELVLSDIDEADVPAGGYDALDDFNDWRKATLLTTNATQTVIWEKTLDDNSSYSLHIVIAGKRVGGAGRGRFERVASVYRESAGVATLEAGHPLIPTVDVNAAAWGGVDVVVTGNKVQVKVTGKVSTNIRWNMAVDIVAAYAA